MSCRREHQQHTPQHVLHNSGESLVSADVGCCHVRQAWRAHLSQRPARRNRRGAAEPIGVRLRAAQGQIDIAAWVTFFSLTLLPILRCTKGIVNAV